MSSTTDGARGQALAVFTLALTAILLVAALAFDTGDVLLERRDEQNAADAAAMAGARYLLDDRADAVRAAETIAGDNGYRNGDNWKVVEVNIPPRGGAFAGFGNAIEVVIRNTRPSIFAGIAGIVDWDVSARAVAAVLNGEGGPWSFLQLDEHACPGIQLGGNQATVDAYGIIHANSTCDQGIKRQASSVMTVHAAENDTYCEVAGDYLDVGGNAGGYFNCSDRDPPVPYVGEDGVQVLPDPLGDFQPPSVSQVPNPPDPVEAVADPDDLGVPGNCPGSSDPATLDEPGTCQFASKYQDSSWILSPGVYPGGLKLLAGTFYLKPGIYFIGGGGLVITGNGTWTYSIEENQYPLPNGVPPSASENGVDVPMVHGGVLLFNTELPNEQMGPIWLNGSDANIYLAPYDGPIDYYDRIVIFQDQRYELDGDEVVLNGGDSNSTIRGTIYVPKGDVKLDGNQGQLTLDQVIGATFKVTGNQANITALTSEDYIRLFNAAGLVE